MNTVDKASFIKENGLYVSTPHGSSMWPFIRGNTDSVAVVPYEGTAGKYDVILYETPDGAHVMHRVIGKKGDVYVVRGDNCFRREYIRDGQIMGVVELVLKNGKTVRRNRGAYLIPIVLWRAIYPVRACLFHLRNRVRRLKKKNGK